eukprot:TRINITY_DN79407_c0_g1_i1.p1 TRINITY_DN79407_c0_g1~~TRINITY_DN79407_c0_g1_i1.p1  ORF type:complete len:829 (+),score=196.39 TRINITY_DN79407_c0_g1_i1:42-2528(+)
MMPSCSAALAAVLSPQQQVGVEDPWIDDEGAHGFGSNVPVYSRKPLATVDDGFLLRRAIWASHRSAVSRLRAVSPWLRLGLELFLLLAALGQLGALAGLHAVLVPSGWSPQPRSPLAAALSAALPSSNVSQAAAANGTQAVQSKELTPVTELLRVEVELHASRHCARLQHDGFLSNLLACSRSEPEVVSCELAAERAILELPAAARQRAYADAGNNSSTVSVRLAASDLGAIFPQAFLAIPRLAATAVSKHILAAVVAGPLQDEVQRREMAPSIFNSSLHEAARVQQENSLKNAEEGSVTQTEATSKNAEAQATVLMLEKWSFFTWGMAEMGFGSMGEKVGSAALAFVSCQGEAPASLQPLRRLAELLDRHVEWWLFKFVWAISTGVLSLLAAVVMVHAIHSALLGIFKIFMGLCRRDATSYSLLDVLEALVLVACPVGLAAAILRVMGDAALDVGALLICLTVGEVGSFCLLHTKESRYLLPRTLMPAYAADVFYTFFYPFGFTSLCHSSLFCYQAFLILTLWGHFESVAQLPRFSLDQLGIEVKLRPSRSQKEQQLQLSASVRKLLFDQGLLLLGDDSSYETGVIMSALILRTLQNTKVPCLPPQPAAPGASALLLPHEALKPLHPEALGGGAAVHMLLNRAFAGDARCGALLAHILTRTEAMVQGWPPVMQLPPQVRGTQVSAARRQQLFERMQQAAALRRHSPSQQGSARRRRPEADARHAPRGVTSFTGPADSPAEMMRRFLTGTGTFEPQAAPAGAVPKAAPEQPVSTSEARDCQQQQCDEPGVAATPAVPEAAPEAPSVASASANEPSAAAAGPLQSSELE